MQHKQRNSRRLNLRQAVVVAWGGLPRAWAGAWGAMVVAGAAWLLAPMAPAGAASWGVGLGLIVVTLVLAGALARVAISDGLTAARGIGLGPAGLQFGWPELRLAGALALCAVFLAMILSVLALALLALFGVAELNVEAIRVREWAAVGPSWKLILLGALSLGLLVTFMLLVVRLSLFAPATLGRGHMVALNSMGVAEGSSWKLLAGLIVTAAPKLVLLVLIGTGILGGEAARIVWTIGLVAVQAPLTMGFLGAAYRQLEYWRDGQAAAD